MDETDRDRRAEERICAVLAKSRGYTFQRLGTAAPFDCWMMKDGLPVAVVEAKRRGHRFLKYRTEYLDLHKWLMLMQVEMLSKVEGLYALGCEDGVFVCRVGFVPVGDDEIRLEVTGRTDRGRDSDRRPTLAIPHRYFQKVEAP